MKKTIFLMAVLYLAAFTAQSKVTHHTTNVYFETDLHVLDADAKTTLNQLAEKVRNGLEYEIVISGHTDNDGGDYYNQQLSLNRANAVKAYLQELSIPQQYIRVNYFGEKLPATPNTDEINKSINRRVEITLSFYEFDNIKELEAELQRGSVQEFVVDPGEKKLLTGNKGIKVLINENTFVDQDAGQLMKKSKWN